MKQHDNIKGVILAGGKGTRLAPLTETVNKHLLPVGKEPMIWHAVNQLVNAGIKDIMIVTSMEHIGDIVCSLGSGSKFNCSFTYRVQEKPLGIVHALSLCKDFIKRNKFVVMLGDNIFSVPISSYVNEFMRQDSGAKILLKKVQDPERYGVAIIREETVVSIVEKPREKLSEYAVIGCYMYDDKAFNYIEFIKPSSRGEYEITCLNNLYIKDAKMSYSYYHDEWIDAGTIESLHLANKIIFDSYRYNFQNDLKINDKE